MKFLFVIVCLFATACTQKPESKVNEALETSFSSQKMTTEISASLDKLYGKTDSKFKSSLVNLYAERFKSEFSNIKAEGNHAKADVTFTVPNRKEVASLVTMTILMDWKVLKDMTLDELIAKSAKGMKSDWTSSKNIKDEKIAVPVALDQIGDGKWQLDADSQKRVATALGSTN